MPTFIAHSRRITLSLALLTAIMVGCASPGRRTQADSPGRRTQAGSPADAQLAAVQEVAEKRTLDILSDPAAREELRSRAEGNITVDPSEADQLWNEHFALSSRGEFETREEYQARLARIGPQDIFFFDLPSVKLSYDIDEELMYMQLTLRERSSMGKLRGLCLDIQSDTTLETKVGTNGFGAESEFIEHSGTTYEAVLKELGIFAGVNGLRMTERGFSGFAINYSFNVAASEAKALKETLRVRAGLSFEGPLASESDLFSVAATRSRSIGTNIYRKFMSARLRSIVIYNGERVLQSFVAD